jgi:NADH:ubiquinone reductase (H+-translocating)
MPKLVILGAGYGGLGVAQKLDTLARGRSNWDVTLVDRRDYHLIQVRVHEVAANSIAAERVKVPFAELLEGFNVKFLQTDIIKILPEQNQVETGAGILSYDKLVIALGSETTYYNIPGLEEHSFPMKFLDDAVLFRKAIIQAFKRAVAKDAAPLVKNDPRLTVIIGGGGLTGTELAAEMTDFINDLAKRAPASRSAFKVYLVEAKPHLLPQLSPSEGDYVKNELRLKGVSVLTNTKIEKVEAGKVYLENGKVIRGDIICWAGGIKAPGIIKESGFETTRDGRVEVDRYLRSKQFANVYLVGDNALILDPRTNQPVGQTGQYAEKQGNYLGESFYQEEKGIKPSPYVPFTLGISVSLGRREALTLSGPLRLTGIPGRIAKDVSYGNYEFNIRLKPRILNPVKNEI